MTLVCDQAQGEKFHIYNADTVEVARALPTSSVDFAVYSPPFSSLFTYSASDRDFGNCSDDGQFFKHYEFLIAEQWRVMKPGRLMAVHCMNLPTSKVRHGHIGMRDFRGEIIRAHEAAGFIYHSEICIWKDPVTAMQRTKALGLLWKQLRKDSCMSRQGIPDFVCVFRKPGVNADPVSHTDEEFPVELWQRYASPVWMDIDQGDTLRSIREDKDERHLCTLQLEVIRRCLKMWSNPGDVVWSPFMGVGSEGYVAIEQGRRFIGAELKASYFKQAVANLTEAERAGKVPDLFSRIGAAQ